MAKKDAAKKDATKKPATRKVATGPGADPVLVAKKASPVVTTTDIGNHLAATFDLPKTHAKIYLNEAVAFIGKHLKKGARVRVSGLGVFQVKKRAARKGRNPGTGEQIKIKAGERVAFTAASDLTSKL